MSRCRSADPAAFGVTPAHGLSAHPGQRASGAPKGAHGAARSQARGTGRGPVVRRGPCARLRLEAELRDNGQIQMHASRAPRTPPGTTHPMTIRSAPRLLRLSTFACRALAPALAALPLLGHAAAPPWKGAAFEGDRAALAQLARASAAVVRVYRERDAWVLDEAARLGMKVIMGLWVAHPRHGFRLDDAAARRAQEEAILVFVARHRAHPALLA